MKTRRMTAWSRVRDDPSVYLLFPSCLDKSFILLQPLLVPQTKVAANLAAAVKVLKL